MKDETRFGDVLSYIEAIRAVLDEGVSPKHLQILQAHYDLPEHTATWEQLAKIVGYDGFRAISLQYGSFAKRIAHKLGISDPPNNFWGYVLVRFADTKGDKGHTAFVLRKPVIEALLNLGIVNLKKDTTVYETQLLEDLEALLEQQIEQACRLPHFERQYRSSQFPSIPKRRDVIVSVFERNPYVIAEVLYRANGYCELCGAQAPFLRKSDGTPYLEVHHKIPLAEGGNDTTENTVALCPNCHRRVHYG